ncbi:hypothetical protein CSKR_201340, partial [Clonorchis sinensis]
CCGDSMHTLIPLTSYLLKGRMESAKLSEQTNGQYKVQSSSFGGVSLKETTSGSSFCNLPRAEAL